MGHTITPFLLHFEEPKGLTTRNGNIEKTRTNSTTLRTKTVSKNQERRIFYCYVKKNSEF